MPEYKIEHEGSKIKVMDGLKKVTDADIWHDQGISKIDFRGIPKEHENNAEDVYGLIFKEVVENFKGRLHLGTLPEDIGVEKLIRAVAFKHGFVKDRIDL